MLLEQTGLEVVAFDLGRLRCGLAINDVERVVRAAAASPLPNAPAIIEGLINIGGEPVAVVDVRRRLGLSPKPIDVNDVLILIRAGARRAAIRADRAVGILKIAADEVREATSVARTDAAIAGVAALPCGVILLHDPQAFLTEAEAVALDPPTPELGGP